VAAFPAGGYPRLSGPSFLLTFAWLGLFVLGLVFYGRRGLWLFLAAPPALLWLVLLGTQLVCRRGCG
jgi:hypothetical protein